MNWTIAQIASVVLCAISSGLLLSFIGHTPFLGYILAGVILGPSGFQFINDRAAVHLFSEMGILFLLFTIGLHMSFEKMRHIWKTSIAVTLISTVVIYAAVLALGFVFNIPHKIVLIITFCVTLSSTAVTAKSLSKLKDGDEKIEHSTYGILIAQDILALIMVLIINVMAVNGAAGYQWHNLFAMVMFCSMIALYFIRYHQYIHKFTNFVKHHDDMLTLIAFGICLGSAVLAELSGFSAPFGAFIAGLILGNSNIRDEISAVAKPIEELLLMTFFLTVGLLVDLHFIYENFLYVFMALVLVTAGKTLINIFILQLCKFELKESFVISVLLGNIGEFSFMLTYAARKMNIIADYAVSFFVSLTALSLFLSPFWFVFAERCRQITTHHASVNSSWELLSIAGSKELKKSKIVAVFFKELFRHIVRFGDIAKELWRNRHNHD